MLAPTATRVPGANTAGALQGVASWEFHRTSVVNQISIPEFKHSGVVVAHHDIYTSGHTGAFERNPRSVETTSVGT